MIGQLYKNEQLDELLAENQFISRSRAETKKTLSLLRLCLNMLNDLDAKF
jgi:dynamin 1-like protein